MEGDEDVKINMSDGDVQEKEQRGLDATTTTQRIEYEVEDPNHSDSDSSDESSWGESVYLVYLSCLSLCAAMI